MKKILLVLSIAIFMFSCTPEDQCGTVTSYSISGTGNYLVYIDGTKHSVDFDTWWNAYVGDYMCIEY